MQRIITDQSKIKAVTIRVETEHNDGTPTNTTQAQGDGVVAFLIKDGRVYAMASLSGDQFLRLRQQIMAIYDDIGRHF